MLISLWLFILVFYDSNSSERVYARVLQFEFHLKSVCLCFTIPISIKEIHYLYYGVLYVQEGDASELSRPIQTMQ